MELKLKKERDIDSLLEIMGKLQLTYDSLAKEIGVSRMTVYNLMKYGVTPQVRIYYKISEYIKRHNYG